MNNPTITQLQNDNARLHYEKNELYKHIEVLRDTVANLTKLKDIYFTAYHQREYDENNTEYAEAASHVLQ